MDKNVITNSLVLVQPWSMEISEGKMKYLVRSFNTKIRGRIGILSTRNYDKIWLNKFKLNDRENKIHYNSRLIGSVDLVNIIITTPKNVKSDLERLGGKEYIEYYPEYFIPYVITGKKLYIWVFDKAKRWKEPIQVTKRYGMQWCKLDLIDE